MNALRGNDWYSEWNRPTWQTGDVADLWRVRRRLRLFSSIAVRLIFSYAQHLRIVGVE